MSQHSSSAAADRPGYYAEILLVSFAALLLEISYTRIVSFELFYYYTYLVIGLALLGIGRGGVLVAVSARLRRAETDRILLLPRATRRALGPPTCDGFAALSA